MNETKVLRKLLMICLSIFIDIKRSNKNFKYDALVQRIKDTLK